MLVGVASVIPPVGVLVGVVVGPFVRVVVGVAVGVFVAVVIRTLVGVAVGVLVRMLVGVTVGVGVAVVPPTGVLVGVPLGVGVQAAIRTAPVPEPDVGAFEPESVPEASISSVMKELSVWQAGAVPCASPMHVSPGVPFG